jgi:hypothetical protein
MTATLLFSCVRSLREGVAEEDLSPPITVSGHGRGFLEPVLRGFSEGSMATYLVGRRKTDTCVRAPQDTRRVGSSWAA